MTTKPIIKIENVSKQYQIGSQEAYYSLRDALADILLFRRRKSGKTFWALKDIGFEVNAGEAIGIIGRNGAGKSTLLKILSQITPPTTGKIKVNGRIASLLEVGTGFHPELTGRENIYLNGAILGMTRQEIRKKFDEIVAFAEVEKFLDTPVKRYSSGMYVRLAFAVAAHLEPEILIVDEVLAVGDAQFQEKCLGKMNDVSKNSGRTVLFVSHNMGAIRQLCKRALLLEQGKIKLIGDTETIVSAYLEQRTSQNTPVVTFPDANSDVYFHKIWVQPSETKKPNNEIDVTSPFSLFFNFSATAPIRNLVVSFSLFNSHGFKVFYSPNDLGSNCQPGTYQAKVTIPGKFLTPGHYYINAALHIPNVKMYDLQENALSLTVLETGSKFCGYGDNDIGAVLVDHSWDIQKI